jgi:hypothetical protein
MTFECEFADGDKRWVPYNTDLFQTEQYEIFCDNNSELLLLKVRLEEAKVMTREINSQAIVNVDVGQTVFVNLRQYGCGWYETLNLPYYEYRKYVIIFKYTEWKGAAHRKICIESELTEDSWTVCNLWVKQFGSCRDFDPDSMTLIDEQFLVDRPEILGETTRERVIARCKTHLGL